MNSILKINDLSKKYSDFSLENISLNLDPGYIMGFIGPNGAGKTTTIKLIMNLIQKDSGEIKLFGENLS
ncbi:MAG TPA: sodium ABC transporter ATP-binding protein, partial [Clostridiales bacterium]|nr:sodium ABC transporter ATP-binding protein [Clostridiales bacterium]